MRFCRQEVLFALLDHNIVYPWAGRVCLVPHYTIMCIFAVVFILAAACLCVSFCVHWGLGRLWTENIPPSRNLCDPAVSLPTAIYFFCTPHTAASSPITQADTHTRSHSPCSPPWLLRVEQGDPGPMRQAARGGGGGQPGENLPRLSLLKLFSSG